MHPITDRELARLHAAELRWRSARPWPEGRRSRRSGRRVRQERAPRSASNDFVRWVLSLPWVVERPYELAPGVRTFAVDCPPLAIRRLWLVVGLGSDRKDGDTPHISVIVPNDVSWAIENAGWGRRVANMPAGHVVMSIATDGESTPDVQALALTGYRYAMA